MKRQMVDSILSLKEYNRYMKGMFDYVGYNTKWISYEAPDRTVGTSKFGLKKLIKYAVEGVTSSSTAPLVTSTFIPFNVAGALNLVLSVIRNVVIAFAILVAANV